MTDIKQWLDKMAIENYIINDNGVVDVEGNVFLHRRGLTSIPVQFGYVSGFFHVGTNKLTSLKGSPREVGGNFFCSRNQLTSLQHGPREVGGDFYCANNIFVTEPDHSFINVAQSFLWQSGVNVAHVWVSANPPQLI